MINCAEKKGLQIHVDQKGPYFYGKNRKRDKLKKAPSESGRRNVHGSAKEGYYPQEWILGYEVPYSIG